MTGVTQPASSCTLLLPPSKGKAEGGDGPAYGIGAAHTGPLAGARTMIMDAVRTEVPYLDDKAAKRICGVRSAEVDWARRLAADVAEAPTMPARHRYTGVVYNNAGLGDRDLDATGVAVRIVSPLLGLAAPDDPVPMYRIEFSASLPHHGSIAAFWRSQAAGVLAAALDAGPVWDLLPGEHARIWYRGATDHPNHRSFAFLRPDGRSANAARTKLLKGRIAGWVLDHADGEPGDLVAHLPLPAGWARGEVDGRTVTFIER